MVLLQQSFPFIVLLQQSFPEVEFTDLKFYSIHSLVLPIKCLFLNFYKCVTKKHKAQFARKMFIPLPEIW